MKKTIISILAIVAITWACGPGEIQLQTTGACVKDCGIYFMNNQRQTFKNCTINQIGKACETQECYYWDLPADTPHKKIMQCLKTGVGCPNKKSSKNRAHQGTRGHVVGRHSQH